MAKKNTRRITVSVTLHLNLWVNVDAENNEQAIKKAEDIARKTPLNEWGAELSSLESDIVSET